MRVFSFFQNALEPIPITVEVHTRFQIPSFQILGLPAPEIQEARERIIAAFSASEFEFPKKKVIINLAPSSLKKSGTGHDLAIAIQILATSLDLDLESEVHAWGELGLDGEIKPCGKMALLLELLLKPGPGSRHVVLSHVDFQQFLRLVHWRKTKELSIPENVQIFPLHCLKEFPTQIKKPGIFLANSEPTTGESLTPNESILLPLSPALERVIEISLIGRHHTLILGPKGMGKSQALHWFQELVPESSPSQTWKRILHGESRSPELLFQTPVRKVHAQIRPAHLTGSWGTGGFRAGELALAHGGLLIADEFMEWPRDSKECLREPLQNRNMVLTRIHGQLAFECDLQMIGTGNLCPCGGLPPQFFSLATLPKKAAKCRCRPREVSDYFQKLSGPIADRIDLICIHSGSHPTASAFATRAQNPEKMKNRIYSARTFALKHFGEYPGNLRVETLEAGVEKNPEIKLMLQPLDSLRSRHKVLRVAHSIQALEQTPTLQKEQVFEAMAYKTLDQMMLS